MNTSSRYAIILGETNFLSREFPRSGSKAKDGEKRRTMASYALQRHLEWRTQSRLGQFSETILPKASPVDLCFVFMHGQAFQNCYIHSAAVSVVVTNSSYKTALQCAHNQI